MTSIAISKNLKVVKVATCDDGIAEVTILDDCNNQKKAHSES